MPRIFASPPPNQRIGTGILTRILNPIAVGVKTIGSGLFGAKPKPAQPEKVVIPNF